MFRTEIPLSPDPKPFSRTARVLTLGSCFADTIGGQLASHKVTTLVNPFGTVFNPLSATLLLRAAAGEAVDWSQHLVEARGRWQSYDLHGSIGADSAESLLARVQELVRQAAEFVKSADVLLLTLGTAWVYRLRETGELVSNCHKQPAALFEKELLSAEDIVGQVAEAHALLRRINPKLRLVLTVSPVRHLRDTLPLNSVSKSVLRLAAHYLSDLLPEVSYFPAFELLTDDLRDYRFYAADMLHPSAVAEDYIWERFARTYFDADFGRFRQEWDGIQQALAHRPLHSGAPEHRLFLETTLEKLRRLAGQQVEARAEIRDVERRLLALPPPPRPRAVAAPELEDDGEERIDIELVAEQAARKQTEPLVGAAMADAADESDADAAVGLVGERPVPEAGTLRPGRNRGRGRPKHRQPDAAGSQALAEKQPAAGPEAAAATVAMPVPAMPASVLVMSAAPAAPKVSYTDFLISSAPELVRTVPAPAPIAAAALATEPEGGADATFEISAVAEAEQVAPKKKRRSRGGAKRTARKNAARLAAEQGGANLPGNPADDAAEADDEFILEQEDFRDAVTATKQGPETGSLTSVATEPASSVVRTSADRQVSATDDALIEAAKPANELPAAEPVAASAAPSPVAQAAPKKRGTGPVARKSNVITKSAPVKRGTRRGTSAVVPAAATTAAEAPKIPAATRPSARNRPEKVVPAPPTAPVEAVVSNQLPTPAAAVEEPGSAALAARLAPAKRAAAAKAPKAAAKSKAAAKPAKSARPAAPKPARKAAPAAGRGKTPAATGKTEPENAAPVVSAVSSVAAVRVAAGSAAGAAAPRRGRPPGSKKGKANEAA